MKPIEAYQGREQTYVKHFFLERYLERVAYNIGSFTNEFVYVDGFSGPWKSEDDTLQDTSFMIAITQLRSVKTGLVQRGRTPQIRCLFVEKDAKAFAALEQATRGVTDIQCEPRNGEFEEMIPAIGQFVGRGFSLVFIDPTGWTGFGLRKIEPLLRHRPSEVIVNFMFDHINRFLEGDRSELVSSFNELYGGPGWESAVAGEDPREESIVEFYCTRLGEICGFDYVVYTRVLKPLSDRTYFYLIYGTRHPKGLVEFRRVEEKMIVEQEKIRLDAKEANRLLRTSQPALFSPTEMGVQSPFESERLVRLAQAKEGLCTFLGRANHISYDNALVMLLKFPLVFERDVKAIVDELQRQGYLRVDGLQGKQRVPQFGQGHTLQRTAAR